MSDEAKTVRCVKCRSEFSNAELEEAVAKGSQGCPACGDTGVPMSIEQDMTIKINWHELRILTIWADNYARQHKEDPGMVETVAAIVKPLEMQRPSGDFAPLTIMGELQELANAPFIAGDIDMVEPDGTRHTIKKKESS